MTQNDPHDALLILRYVSWGKLFLKEKTLPGHFAAQVVSHHQKWYHLWMPPMHNVQLWSKHLLQWNLQLNDNC